MNKARVTQINFVTRDLERIKSIWSVILGKEPDAEYHIGDFGVQYDFMDGKQVDCSDVRAVKYLTGKGSMEDFLSGCAEPENFFFLAFWQPGEKQTPWKKYLDEHGEGIMDIELQVPNRNTVYQALKTEPYHVGYFPDSTYSFVHAADMALTDLNITQNEDNEERFLKIRQEGLL